MSPELAPRYRHRPGLVELALITGVAVLVPGPASQASQAAYPTREALRALQLHTFECARDNQPGPCEQARRQADPLLDHPRLPGSCKDILWQIREQAVVAASNNFARRDRLDRAAVEMMRSYQAGTRSVAPSADPNTPARPGGFGLVPSR